MVKYIQNIDELRRAGKQPQTCAECEHRIILTQTGDSVCEPQDLLVDVAAKAAQYCRDLLDAKVGEKVIITAGLPFNVTGNTNLLHIFTIAGRAD